MATSIPEIGLTLRRFTRRMTTRAASTYTTATAVTKRIAANNDELPLELTSVRSKSQPTECVIVRRKIPNRTHEALWLCRFHAMRSNPTMAATQETMTARAAAPPAATASSMKWVGLAVAIALGLLILII